MIILAQCRKEEERKSRLTLQQRVAQDETLVTLQRQLEKKRQERQRLKQTESKKAKTSEKKTTTHTIKNIETHDRVSMKSKDFSLSVFVSVVPHSSSCFLVLPEKLEGEKLGGTGAKLRASYTEDCSLCSFLR